MAEDDPRDDGGSREPQSREQRRLSDLVPKLETFVASWERDKAEGITLRAIRNDVKGLRGDFDKHQQEMRDRVKALETRNEVEDKRDQVDALAGRGVAISTPQAFPTPFGPQVPPWPPQPPRPTWQDFTPPMGTQAPQMPAPMQLPADRTSQHTIVVEAREHEPGFFGSIWKKLKKYLSHSIAVFLAAMFTLGIQWLAGHGCGPAQKVQSFDNPAGTAATLR